MPIEDHTAVQYDWPTTDRQNLKQTGQIKLVCIWKSSKYWWFSV